MTINLGPLKISLNVELDLRPYPLNLGLFVLRFDTLAPSDEDKLLRDTRARVIALLKEERKIIAIKVYREGMGVPLKEAKEAVEAIQREEGL